MGLDAYIGSRDRGYSQRRRASRACARRPLGDVRRPLEGSHRHLAEESFYCFQRFLRKGWARSLSTTIQCGESRGGGWPIQPEWRENPAGPKSQSAQHDVRDAMARGGPPPGQRYVAQAWSSERTSIARRRLYIYIYNLYRRNRSRVLWALASLNTVFSTAGAYFTDQEVKQVDLARKTFFGAWARLHEEPGNIWPVIPKHHAAQHVLRDAVRTRRNPGSYWCFAGEHVMGLSKRSLGGYFQKGLDNRILRFGLARWGIEAARSES